MSDDDLFGQYLTPSSDALKEKLPIQYVAPKLGIALDQTGRGLCPFHDDADPSLYLWDGDDGQTRWHCQVCATGGDIFDLIQRKRNVSFSEAIGIAAEFLAEMPADFMPPERVPLPPADPSMWADEVASARGTAARPDYHGIMAALVGFAHESDIEACKAWDAYLREQWGWGINKEGTIYMPHFNAEGVLTGCKLRPRVGTKKSLPGSRYGALYGAWRGRLHNEVFLTEGESDAIYAAYSAMQEGLDIDVFALPRGAGALVGAEELTLLARAKIIYLCYDPDDAGVAATRKWIEHLDELGFANVRVCCLPLGRDLRSAQPTMRRLLAEARIPLPPPDDIAQAPGGYVRADAKGNMFPVTNWTVEPKAQLAGGDDPGFDVVLTHAGIDSSTIIKLSDFASTLTLNKWANRHNLLFTGTDNDRKRVAEFVKAHGHITPEIFQTARIGLHDPPREYAFAGPSVVYPEGYVGKLPWRYTPSDKVSDLSGRILLPAPGAFDWGWFRSFCQLSSDEVMHPILAWIVAAARRPEAHEFPLLFIGGSSGVGKSTLSRLALRLAGSKVEVDLGGATPYILLQTLASTTSIPVFVDEWSQMSRRDAREAFKGYLPVLYAGGLAERGQSDLRTVRYPLTSPVLVAGEDTFMLDRERERMVSVFPTHAAQNHLALASIVNAPLERFAYWLHVWLATGPSLPPIDAPAPNRPTHNIQVLIAGWETLREFLAYVAQNVDNVPELPHMPNIDALLRVPESATVNVYELAIQEGVAMTDTNGLPLVWPDPAGRGTWVRARSLIGELKRRQIDIELPGRSIAMLDYFRERYTVSGGDPITPPMGTKPLRAHLIAGLHVNQEEE